MYFLLSEDGLGEVEKVLLRERAFIATSEFFECLTFGDGVVEQNRFSRPGSHRRRLKQSICRPNSSVVFVQRLFERGDGILLLSAKGFNCMRLATNVR